jgi:hypothetical protein
MGQERRKSGRRRNDRRASDTKPTLTNEKSVGGVRHDERGDAHWVWASEQQAQESAERTFNELKALDNEALALLEQSDPAQSKSPPGGGYNPYDVATPLAKKPARKTRR